MDEIENPYRGREQSQAKHFILKRYLSALAYKILGNNLDKLTYVDGFSGPWQSQTENFSDTSFMIAIDVLKNAHRHFESLGQEKKISCVFIEKDPTAFAQLERAVMAHHAPEQGFFIKAVCDEFENTATEVAKIMGDSFSLTFIDPTGWTGYGFADIWPLLRHKPGEVLINVMYDHMNRFINSQDPETISSFAPILGGEDWPHRLDPALPKGKAVLKLLCSELSNAGEFKHVVATKIDQAASDRPHYFLTYGTRSWRGLKTFRDIEFKSLRDHEEIRRRAKFTKNEEKSRQMDLLGPQSFVNANAIETVVAEQILEAKSALLSTLRSRKHPVNFETIAATIMTEFMLRETNVKDICKELADKGFIKATWKLGGSRRHKPHEQDLIELL